MYVVACLHTDCKLINRLLELKMKSAAKYNTDLQFRSFTIGIQLQNLSYWKDPPIVLPAFYNSNPQRIVCWTPASSLVPVCLLSSQCTAGVWWTGRLQEETNRHWNSSDNGFGLPLLFWEASSTFSLAPNFTHKHLLQFSSIFWSCAGRSRIYCRKRVSHRVCSGRLVHWNGFLDAVSVSTIWSIVYMLFFSWHIFFSKWYYYWSVIYMMPISE